MSAMEDVDASQSGLPDYDATLSKADIEELHKHQHCMDYPLTDEHISFMNENGYVVIKELIDNLLCDEIVDEMFEKSQKIFKMNEKDKDTWPTQGFVDLWHVSSVYKLRQDPKLYSVHAQLYKTHKLCVAIDRVSMKPPAVTVEDQEFSQEGNRHRILHWDTNMWAYDSHYAEFQCGICLRDCPEGCGGFFCIPKMHKKFACLFFCDSHRAEMDKYKQKYLEGKLGKVEAPSYKWPGKTYADFEDKEYADNYKIEVPLQKGDVVIWSTLLPHNGGFNTLPDQWRLHAFVRFLALDGPCVNDHQKKWAEEYKEIVLDAFKTGERPTHFASMNPTGGRYSNKIEIPYHKPPPLTWLGERLLGLTPWEETVVY